MVGKTGNLINVPAVIDFEIPHVTKKHFEQKEWKVVICALIEGDITDYYAWFIKKRFNLSLVKPLRGGHISFISDRLEEINNLEEVKAKWHGIEVNVRLDINVRTNGKYWWLRANCSEFDLIRTELGLSKPFYPFHLTIGKYKEKDLEIAKYYLKYAQH